MEVSRLRALFDVDIGKDLEHLRRELENAPREIALQTRKWMNEFAWSAS
jgi:hypothetical protein